MKDFSTCKPGDRILTEKGGMVVVVEESVRNIWADGKYGRGRWKKGGLTNGPNATKNYGPLVRILAPGEEAEPTAPTPLTLRQQYKIAVMTAILSDPNAIDETTGTRLSIPAHATRLAYAVGAMADAMIAEDEKHAKKGGEE